MILKILLALVLVVAAFIGFAATRPSTFRVERSIAIAAPASVLFPRVNDMRQLFAWSPWKDRDPNASYTFEGPASGVGASQAWSGNSDVGSGKQTIVESRPNELVRLKLEFFKPMEGVCDVTLALKPEAGQTRVVWTMTGENNLMGKIFCLFVNQDKMIGDDFEKGLATLKRTSEGALAKTN
jgi:hypothetical protein